MGIRRKLRRLMSGSKPGKNRAMRSLAARPGGSGRMLLSYILDPFEAPSEEAISLDHTHHWESWQIARSFLEAGFDVDVIHYTDREFVPQQAYDVLVSARTQLERLAGHLPDRCLKIAHLDTAHWLTNNARAYERLLACRDRLGVTLRDNKLVEQNWAIEAADIGCVLGNDWTAGTYAYAGKPVHRIPISVPAVYDWGGDKDIEACRNNFIWFGSSGFVHKGLDLVLEAFRELPDHRLYVCGPFDAEPRFTAALKDLLFDRPNVVAEGWVDVAGDRFREIASQCIGLVYPSCVEGGGASAITCMHAGIIPIVTLETSVDTPGFGVGLRNASVEEIRQTVRELSAWPAEELRERARAARDYARAHHTREGFAKAYNAFVQDVVVPAVDARRGG